MSDKIIIGVHGLDSKPSEAELTRMWDACIRTGLELSSGKSAVFDFEMAYWANEMPAHVEDDMNTNRGVWKSISDQLKVARDGETGHVGLGERFKLFFKDRTAETINMMSRALTLKDNVMRGVFDEIKMYQNDQYIADKIRKPLEDKLRYAWDNNKDICLLSHSMGTFIAYDVLWRFTHSGNPEYRDYRNKVVDLFITAGSPLGDADIKKLMLCDKHKEESNRFYPSNINKWHNYSALGDIVCHDADLENDFMSDMDDLGMIGSFKDYKRLHNGYITPSGNPNPHKSFSYLLQPKMNKHISRFLK